MTTGELGPRSRPVYDSLRQRIVGGDLPPGAQLPAHQQLAAEFGVAPMTVRQVLTHLEHEGLITKHVGRGTFVRRRPDLTRAASADDTAGLWAALSRLLLLGNREQTLRFLIDAVVRGVGVEDVFVDVLAPALKHVGELWETNRVTVADEHLATAIAELAIGALSERTARKPRNGRRVVVACAEGELHTLGARMLSELLDADGFDVLWLGADVPSDALATMVQSRSPDLAVISATMTNTAEPLAELVSRLRATGNAELRLAVGGQAFAQSPKLLDAVGADFFGVDARQTVRLAREALGVDRRA